MILLLAFFIPFGPNKSDCDDFILMDFLLAFFLGWLESLIKLDIEEAISELHVVTRISCLKVPVDDVKYKRG